MLPPLPEYHDNNPPTLLIFFGLRDLNAVEWLHRERAAWQGDSDIEMLGPEHAVLLVYVDDTHRRLTS
jgi:hypothetical protein